MREAWKDVAKVFSRWPSLLTPSTRAIQLVVLSGRGTPRRARPWPSCPTLLEHVVPAGRVVRSWRSTRVWWRASAQTGDRRSMQALRVEFGQIPASTSAIVAALISVLGILAFVAVVLRS